MTVKDLIDELMKIEDKTMEVRLADWAEGHCLSRIVYSVEIIDSYMRRPCTPYLCLESKGDLIP